MRNYLLSLARGTVFYHIVIFFYCFIKIAFCSIDYVNAMRQEYTTKIFYPFGIMLEPHFMWMLF